ncbi:radical SAM protein [Desulfobacula sp.]|uniref:B12-binding domain-containing radical SAM protein n=1 Tax=Desulfobacula sp. TaxID=2593537 RepID=UPI0025C59F45|nr:radical SAM protein [Desulfobacula sp.]MBC2703779.1 radical SAM protein [Desulfobacula sp.]
MVKQKKILLVNPSCLDTRISGEDAHIVPIGLYYIGALLIENSFETKLVNLADGRDDPVKVFKKLVTTEQPDVIGFSVINPNRWNAMECARAAKQFNPDITIVFGGPAPTFLARHLLTACPDIDFIVAGEGEITFLELITQLENKSIGPFKNINGLVFKKDNRIVRTSTRHRVEVLDTLVHPSKYFIYQHLAMSRGCPGKCTFCGSPKFWGNQTLRFHSPKWFADEVESLVKKGVTHFYISDDTFTTDKQQVIEFCDHIINRKLNITWNAISRVDAIDEDILFSMRKAGCIQLSFGVESGSEKIRKILGKPIKRDKIINTFSLTASYGILPRAYFIYGSPGETDKTIQESIDLLKDIRPLSAIFYLLVIFPGTYLYQKMVNQHLISDDIWYQKIEDIPWFEVDDHLDFAKVKAFGDRLRSEFYNNLDAFARQVDLVNIKELIPFHADFLSRLAMTFSHGEYAADIRIKNQDKTAQLLYTKALSFAPDSRAFLGLAMLHQKQRNFNDAISILEKGLEHSPENKNLNICMGVCLMNTGRFKHALDFFEKFGESPETNHYINICHQKISGH